MKKTLLALLLSFSCMGCGAAIAAALLSGGDVNDLVDNVEETIQTQQQLSQYAMKAARGELDISQYDYDPPTVDNGMTGTLTLNDGQLPFGDGDVQVVFHIAGDGEPLDPYGRELASMGQLDGDVQIVFAGTSPNGKPLNIDADVDVTTLANSTDSVTALLAGAWDIRLDGYRTNLSTSGVELDVDLLTDEVTRAVGTIDGDVDIPNFPIDGDFDIEGLGDSLAVAINVAITSVDFNVSLSDLF